MQLFIPSLVRIVDVFCQIYFYIVIARALISWVNPDPYNPIVRFLYNVTEPVLSRLRRLLPLEFGGFDLSPIVLLLGLEIVRRLLIYLLLQAY